MGRGWCFYRVLDDWYARDVFFVVSLRSLSLSLSSSRFVSPMRKQTSPLTPLFSFLIIALSRSSNDDKQAISLSRGRRVSWSNRPPRSDFFGKLASDESEYVCVDSLYQNVIE